MAVPSVQDIQEQIRQQQIIGGSASPQPQPFHPIAAGGNYAPFVPQVPVPMSNAQPNGRANEIPISMGKLSLLTISFSLMLLGAFTFLGGFLLGIWVAGPRVSQPMSPYLPSQQAMPYYPTSVPYYPQGAGTQQVSNDLERRVGSVTESAIKDTQIQGVPAALSPFVKVAQSEIGRQVGEKTEDFLKQQLRTNQHYSQPQGSLPSPSPVENYSPQPSGGHTQLPVVTPQSGAASTPAGVSFSPISQENGETYTIQLGVYASHENANALVNHLQALNYPSQVTEGKAPDGSTIYYVHNGLYKDYTTALNAASRFASQNIPGAIIVKIGPQHKSAL